MWSLTKLSCSMMWFWRHRFSRQPATVRSALGQVLQLLRATQMSSTVSPTRISWSSGLHLTIQDQGVFHGKHIVIFGKVILATSVDHLLHPGLPDFKVLAGLRFRLRLDVHVGISTAGREVSPVILLTVLEPVMLVFRRNPRATRLGQIHGPSGPLTVRLNDLRGPLPHIGRVLSVKERHAPANC